MSSDEVKVNDEVNEVDETEEQEESEVKSPEEEVEEDEPSAKEEVEKEGDEDEEEDEEEDEDEDESKTGSGKKEPFWKEGPLIVEGKREKKKVERLSFQASPTKNEPFKIEEGKGEKLGEIERIQHFMSQIKSEELKPLHKLLYGRPGTVASVKRNIRQFSGFPFEKNSEPYKKKEELLKKHKNSALKMFCGVLDLEKSGTSGELVERIMSFLMKPKSTGKSLPKSKKKSQKSSKKDRRSSGSARKSKGSKSEEKILSDESSSEDEKNEDSSDEEKESEDEKPPKKVAKKKETPKSAKKKRSAKPANVKKADSSTTKKGQKSSKKETESDDSSDDEPLIKKIKKPPTDEELKATIKRLLADTNLEEVTMKQICKNVYEKYPSYDLTDRKDFIKKTVKELIS
ncbi:protein DEK isoform X2 [Protopterus annectens]|nr:protein DEK isoform X2 [Protopterus annectens]XP_043921212.1 protein DEK isoform X2 [Protopterus annectens]